MLFDMMIIADNAEVLRGGPPRRQAMMMAPQMEEAGVARDELMANVRQPAAKNEMKVREDKKLKEVDQYLIDNQLEPKRKYSENRNGVDYLVYYFGHCYLADHLEILSEMADGEG